MVDALVSCSPGKVVEVGETVETATSPVQTHLSPTSLGPTHQNIYHRQQARADLFQFGVRPEEGGANPCHPDASLSDRTQGTARYLTHALVQPEVPKLRQT